MLIGRGKKENEEKEKEIVDKWRTTSCKVQMKVLERMSSGDMRWTRRKLDKFEKYVGTALAKDLWRQC